MATNDPTQRPGPRDAWIATVTRWPGSQPMVRPHSHFFGRRKTADIVSALVSGVAETTSQPSFAAASNSFWKFDRIGVIQRYSHAICEGETQPVRRSRVVAAAITNLFFISPRLSVSRCLLSWLCKVVSDVERPTTQAQRPPDFGLAPACQSSESIFFMHDVSNQSCDAAARNPSLIFSLH